MLAVGCMMAGAVSGPVPFPLTMSIFVLLLTGTPVLNSIPVMTAALTAHLVFRGVFLGNPAIAGRKFRDIDAALQEVQEVELEVLLEEKQG